MKAFKTFGVVLATSLAVATIAGAQKDEKKPQTNPSENKTDTRLDLALREGQTFRFNVEQTQTGKTDLTGTGTARDERVAYAEERDASGQYELTVKSVSGGTTTLQVMVKPKQAAGATDPEGHADKAPGSDRPDNPDRPESDRPGSKPLPGTEHDASKVYTIKLDEKGMITSCEAGGGSSGASSGATVKHSSCEQVIAWIVGSGLHGKSLDRSEVYKIECATAGKSGKDDMGKQSPPDKPVIGDVALRFDGSTSIGANAVARFDVVSADAAGKMDRPGQPNKPNDPNKPSDPNKPNDPNQPKPKPNEDRPGVDSPTTGEGVVGTATYRMEDGLIERLTVRSTADGKGAMDEKGDMDEKEGMPKNDKPKSDPTTATAGSYAITIYRV